MSRIVARQIRVSGRVQGVGFRAALRDEAHRLGLAGWVRNRLDGSVEAMLQGAPESVDALISWARSGPPAAKVTALRVDEAPSPQMPGQSFEVRPTA